MLPKTTRQFAIALVVIVGLLGLYILGNQPRDPYIHALACIGQPASLVKEKFGEPLKDTTDESTFFYGNQVKGLSELFFFIREDRCVGMLAQFASPEGTSLGALERVGLGAQGISRPATEQTDAGWTYLNQSFGALTLSSVKTLGRTGNYHGVRIQL